MCKPMDNTILIASVSEHMSQNNFVTSTYFKEQAKIILAAISKALVLIFVSSCTPRSLTARQYHSTYV